MDTPTFGSLADAKALAAACGCTKIYDDRYKSASPLNLTGAVSLTEWPGLTGKNGEPYEYAFNGTHIIAQPALPPNHGLNLHPKDYKEVIDVGRQASEMRKSVGPTPPPFLLA